jgi:hypothetical protein
VNEVAARQDGASPGRTPPTPSTLDPLHAPLAYTLLARAAYGSHFAHSSATTNTTTATSTPATVAARTLRASGSGDMSDTR